MSQRIHIEPDPKRCAHCGSEYGWVWDEDDKDWRLDAEWWFDPAIPGFDPQWPPEEKGFTCSGDCYRARYPGDTSDWGSLS